VQARLGLGLIARSTHAFEISRSLREGGEGVRQVGLAEQIGAHREQAAREKALPDLSEKRSRFWPVAREQMSAERRNYLQRHRSDK